ncbi:nitroreductase family protein [Devosia beringensis]|uniref:nitroreductase family protein n=1 Tax=Devosia beringensis TaxID=2657486 RepID=UPI00186BA65D|nr:nitroreductase family protein [Devosia beringensis]
MPLTRRTFFAASALVASLLTGRAMAQSVPETLVGFGAMSLSDALARRESIRTYTDSPIEEAQLLALLGAANGVNRGDVDGRTAPSWRTAKDIEIYVAQAAGISHYDVANNALLPVSGDDIRSIASPQPFVAKAPALLIFVTELSRILEAAGLEPDALDALTEDHRIAAHVNAAVIAQNVYLFCAAEGLGTCLVGGADRAALASALKLTEGQLVAYIQPVGHPAG